MNYRRLGDAGLKLSEISLGGWMTFGNTFDIDRARAIFDRAFEVAELGLHQACAKEPVQAMEMRADSVGMHEAASLSDPADRVGSLALAGIERG